MITFMIRSFICVLVLINFGFSSTFEKLPEKLKTLQSKYSNFGVLIIDSNSGLPLFCYNSNLIYNKKMTPGSTIKPFTLIAVNKVKPVRPEKKYKCPGWGDNPNKVHLCWFYEGHTNVNLVQAVAYSCNYYFRELVKEKFDPAVFVNILSKFRIIKNINKIGLSKNIKENAVGFGNYIQTTPYRMLYAYNMILNGGKLFNVNGKVIDTIDIDNKILASLYSGMEASYSYGTSRIIQDISGYKKGMAKTGTAMMFEEGKWYRDKLSGLVVVFLPSGNIKIGMVVFIQKGKGNKEAARIAGEIIKIIKNEY